jgi:hypothetical protein
LPQAEIRKVVWEECLLKGADSFEISQRGRVNSYSYLRTYTICIWLLQCSRATKESPEDFCPLQDSAIKRDDCGAASEKEVHRGGLRERCRIVTVSYLPKAWPEGELLLFAGLFQTELGMLLALCQSFFPRHLLSRKS